MRRALDRALVWKTVARALVTSPELTWMHHHITSSHLHNGGSQPLSGPQFPLLSNVGWGPWLVLKVS